jgi:DNA polymerase elongation subunit (family B)
MSVSNKYHGKRLMFPGTRDKGKLAKFLSRMPKRTNFISSADKKSIERAVAHNEEILFLPNDLKEDHIFDRTSRRRAYKIILMGVLEGGQKAAVILNGIEVFFDVRVPDDAEVDKFSEAVRRVLNEEDIAFKKVKRKDQYPFKLFHEKPVPYIRVYFDALYDRKKAIKRFREQNTFYYDKKGFEVYSEGLETAADDMSCYYRKAAREYKFRLAGWNSIKKYRTAAPNKYTKEECYSYTFEVDVNDFIDIEKLDKKLDPKEHPDLQKDKSMVMCWDLETDDLKPTGNAPMPDDVFDDDGEPRAIIEIDCCSFHWQYSRDPMLVVAISVMPAPIRDDCLFIQVRNQLDIIRVKALLTERMAPEFLTGFNDGGYDWPMVNRRVEMYDMQQGKKLHEFMKTHMSSIPYTANKGKNGKIWENVPGIKQERRIKVEADTYLDIENFDAPGFICVDARLIFRQLFPTAEKTSLNFFLAINKLGSKADMDYLVMFKIFRLMRRLVQKFKTRDFDKIKKMFMAIMATKGDDHCPLKDDDNKDGLPADDTYRVTQLNCKDMLALIEMTTDVIHYCNVDARRCQELLNVRNVIPDKREVVNLSYTSMYDGFYRAGGMKVRNMVISVGIEPEWNLAISNISTGNKTEKKYPGAWVVPPTKGLYRDHKILKRRRRELADELGSVGGTPEAIGVVNRFAYEDVNPQSENFRSDLLDDKKFGLTVEPEDGPEIVIQYAEEDGNYMGGRLPAKTPRFKSARFASYSGDMNDKSDRPCTGLDFSSLYPRLICTYNLSPEKIVLTDERAAELRKKGYVLHEINFHYGFDNQTDDQKEHIHGYSVRHVPKKEVKDGKATWTYEGMGIYPSILDELFNKRKVLKKQMGHYTHPKEWIEGMMKNPEFIKLSTIHSASDLAAAQREFVRKALDKELAEKQALVDANKGTRKEGFYGYQVFCVKQVDKFLAGEGFFDEFVDDSANELTLQSMYPDVSFWWNYYNSKQLALKMFMNTFYGETGNSLSPFFLVHVAGGITMGGQWNIKFVRDFVLENKYQVLYGDTDSLYICCPESCFEEVDRQYENGEIDRLQYWTRMVEITMETIDDFKDAVNNLLEENNGTPFLTMAYEEVLWPFALVGKKKYIGIKHEGIVNFAICMPECTLEEFMKSKSLFIRGLEVKKRGSSEFLKLVCFEIFRQAFCVTQTLTLREIVEQQIAEVSRKKWDPKLFIKSARYKLPAKDKPGNVTVLSFVERMKYFENNHPKLGIKIPEVGERFQYVVTKKYPWTYDMRGRQVNIKIGDKYEYFESMENEAYHDVLGEPLELDMDYYMLNEIIGQFGRFIVYHPYYDKFGPDKLREEWTDEECKKADEKSIVYAKKTLQAYYKQNFAAQFEKRGKTYQKVFKEVNTKVAEWNRDQYGDAAVLFDITKTLTTGTTGDSIMTQRYNNQLKVKIMKEAEKAATKGAKARIQSRIKDLTNKRKKNGMSVRELYRLYVTAPNAIFKVQEEVMTAELKKAEKQLRDMIPDFKAICMENTSVMSALVNNVRTKETFTKDGKTPVINFKIIDRGIEYLQKQNKSEISQTDIDELLDAIEDYESDSSDESSEDEIEPEETERHVFVYDMFDVYAKIIAVRRIMIENEMMKEYLDHGKKLKAGIHKKPPGFSNKKTADDFEQFQLKRLQKRDPRMDLP